MKNLKLLNKKYLSIILFYLLFGFATQSQEPIDIWNIEEKKTAESTNVIDNNEEKDVAQNSIYKMQSEKNNKFNINNYSLLLHWIYGS